MKLKYLMEKYGEYEVSEAKGDWCDASHITLELNKPKPKSVWDLGKGDKYFVACYKNSTYTYDMRTWGNSDYEKAGRETGILFLTKEEAKKDVERKKVEALLLKYGGRRWFKRDNMNYLLEYDYKFEKLTYTGSGRPAWQGLIYFDTKAQIENAIEKIGEERLKKALFEVR